jgi:hypothetical protein
VRVSEITVTPGAIEAILLFDAGEGMRTSDAPEAVPRLLRVLPGLRGHGCDNDAGQRFADELADTELAHLLEHATLEIMAMAGSPVGLRGSTSWDFKRDGRGVFRVRVAYDDDLVALGALKAAEATLRWAVTGEGTRPDVEGEARRLRGLRSR